jgi:hypothetical protein
VNQKKTSQKRGLRLLAIVGLRSTHQLQTKPDKVSLGLETLSWKIANRVKALLKATKKILRTTPDMEAMRERHALSQRKLLHVQPTQTVDRQHNSYLDRLLLRGEIKEQAGSRAFFLHLEGLFRNQARLKRLVRSPVIHKSVFGTFSERFKKQRTKLLVNGLREPRESVCPKYIIGVDGIGNRLLGYQHSGHST